LSVLAAITQANSIRISDAERKEAISLLKLARQPRRNHGTFEELKGDDFERECNQEICDREELDEIFSDKDEADKKWRELTDQCSLNPCNSEGTAKCVQRWKNRSCICKEHEEGIDTVAGVARFTGETCEEDFNECEDAAANTKCGDRHCINTHGSFECGCEDGYEADESGTCVDIDECARGIDSCGANAKCVNDPGSHHCECDIGFEADPEDPNSCIDTDECQDPDTCPSVGLSKKCENTIGSYACVCDEPGYYDSNGICEDINECPSQPCSGPTSSCQNLPGSFSCQCGQGYALDESDKVCVDINECEDISSCLMGSCWNTPGSFECCTTATHDFNQTTGECTLKDPCADMVCNIGYECEITNVMLNEANCVDVNECNQEDPVCGMDETCKNTQGSYVCIPPPTAALAPTTEATTTPEVTTTTTTTTTTSTKRRCRRPRRRGRSVDGTVYDYIEEFECQE